MKIIHILQTEKRYVFDLPRDPLMVVGVLFWLVNTCLPMDAKIKKFLNIVVVICVVLWLLSAFGVLGHTGDIRVPQVR